MKKLAVLFAVFLLFLTGCEGNPLPEGMDEETLLTAGETVMHQFIDGAYEDIWAELRPSVQETTTVDAIEAHYLLASEELGDFDKVASTLATGDTDDSTGEHYGIAVLIAEYQKGDVRFRLAFDKEMTLIGMAIAEN